jgi:hypothetical protein
MYDSHRRAVEYARAHAGVAPKTVAELTAGQTEKEAEWIVQGFRTNPYLGDRGLMMDGVTPDEVQKTIDSGPHYALLPGVRFVFKEGESKTGNPTNHDPYIVELHPLYADGKHWVVYADGRHDRVEIDEDLMARHGLTVTALLPDPDAPREPAPEQATYTVYAISSAGATGRFDLLNVITGEHQTCNWDATKARPGDAEIAKEWAVLRVRGWEDYLEPGSDSPILRHWAAILARQYGAQLPPAPRNARRQRGQQTDAFGVLGGRAAMRETFQMQVLAPGAEDEGPGVPLAEIAGVEVKSHPYAEMLGGRAGGNLAIAEAVPLDRFMLYVRRPDALLPMLGQGSAFLARVGAGATGRSLSYQLEDRYLGRLGMDRAWLEQFLKSGLVSEMAIVLPDLFVVDGTEFTVVSRVAMLKPVLGAVGATNLAEGRVTSVRTADGQVCYWGLVGDLVVVSTSREEIDRVMGAKAGRTESLGTSAEFRYMLTELAPDEQTRMFAYFSDPFIRHLVGPEVKISQLRRVKERARLEALTAAALLYRADGHADAPTIQVLQAGKYLNANTSWEGIALDGQGRAVSQDYGRLGSMASVSACPVLLATSSEAEAYRQYVTAYTRFWRRFFDPIAVRVNDTEDGGLAVETFILPLLDNSMYDSLRGVLNAGDDAKMAAPVLSPDPVLMASMSLGEKVWRDMLGDMFERSGGQTASAALDRLGPSVHIALHDSDPIIAFGSGEMLGLGGTMFGGRGQEMIAIPLMISTLTRPLTIAVEVQDMEPVRQFLESGMLQRLVPWQREMGGQASWYRMGDKDAWVLGMGVFGIGIRFRFQLEGGYLLISNLPWMERTEVAGTRETQLGAFELRLRPDLVEEQLAAMFTATHERQRLAAFAGMGYLLPFVDSGMGVPESLAAHRRLLAFAPTHPADGAWQVVDGSLTSTVYGTPRSPRQPEFAEGTPRFGLLQGVTDLRVALQFEDEGLRTLVRWQYTPQ